MWVGIYLISHMCLVPGLAEVDLRAIRWAYVPGERPYNQLKIGPKNVQTRE